MRVKFISIGSRPVGSGHPCFIVAEAGVNHNGDPELARRLIDAAALAGADAVKFQTFKAECVTSAEAPKAAYQRATTGESGSQLQMLRMLELSVAAHRELAAHALKRGLVFLSTPFDEGSVELLDDLGVPAFKVASGELTNLRFLAAVARRGKPVILSTGMAYLGEVETAVHAIREAGNESIVLLHCVSTYPAEPSDANLAAMATMADAFGLPVGFSDHTAGIEVSLAAAALGAAVIEKHFTLDRTLAGPDHRASLEPDALAAMVRGIRTVEAARGTGDKRPVASEADTRRVARRSLHLRRAAGPGEALTDDMLVALRPGLGIPPSEWDAVVGRRLRRAAPAGTRLAWDDLT
jgi:N-acetylneuraminate synthase/N,N'-diacetyllegionaminate synthase